MTLTPIEQRSRLLHLIHRHGLERIVAAMHNPGIMAMEGRDLTGWRRTVLDGGALYLAYVGSPNAADPGAERRQHLINAIAGGERLRALYATDPQWQVNVEWRESAAAKNEAEQAAARAELAAMPEPRTLPVQAAVLCVNAEPSTWHSWLAGVAQQPVPTALLLCQADGRVIYGSTPFKQPLARRVPLIPLDEIDDLPFETEELAGPAFRGPAAFHPARRDPVADMLQAARGPRNGSRY